MRPVPAVESQFVVVQNSYVGLTVGWLLSGIQAIVPIGSVVMKRAVADRGVVAEPALGEAVTVDVHAGAAGVVDLDLEVRAGRDRRRRRDHELVGRALHALQGGGGAARRAGRRERVGRVDRVAVGRGVRGGVGIVRAVRVARVGRLLERERRRLTVDRDRGDRHVRARRRRAGDRVRALEVEAELGQALRRLLREVDVGARQEQVRRGVVVEVDVRVDARVARVARLGVQARARLGQRPAARAALGAPARRARAWRRSRCRAPACRP